MVSNTMINGVMIDVSSEEIEKMMRERAMTLRREGEAEAQRERARPILDVQADPRPGGLGCACGLTTQTYLTKDAVETLCAQIMADADARARVWEFAAAHVIPGETYRLSFGEYQELVHSSAIPRMVYAMNRPRSIVA